MFGNGCIAAAKRGVVCCTNLLLSLCGHHDRSVTLSMCRAGCDRGGVGRCSEWGREAEDWLCPSLLPQVQNPRPLTLKFSCLDPPSIPGTQISQPNLGPRPLVFPRSCSRPWTQILLSNRPEDSPLPLQIAIPRKCQIQFPPFSDSCAPKTLDPGLRLQSSTSARVQSIQRKSAAYTITSAKWGRPSLVLPTGTSFGGFTSGSFRSAGTGPGPG